MTQASPYRVFPLIGPDGVGKSSLAQAMAEVAGATPRSLVVDGRPAVVIDIARNGFVTQLVDFGDQMTEQYMLGTSRAQGAILVVSSLDSVLPGTLTSLEMARQCGIPIVAVALTKCDQVADPEMLDLITMEIQEAVTKMHGRDTPIIATTTSREGQRERMPENDPMMGPGRLLRLVS